MDRTFKYYLKLTKFQKQQLRENLSNCNFLYNLILGKYKTRDKNKQKQPTEYQTIKSVVEIKNNYPQLKKTNANVLQEVAKRVHRVWKNYLIKLRGENKVGYPRFKPPHRYNSFTYLQPIEKNGCGYKISNLPLTKKKEIRDLKLTLGRQDNHNVYLVIKLVMERNWEGKVKNLTISQKNGRYYSLFSCQRVKINLLTKTNKKVGLDVNLKKSSYLTTSDSRKYQHPNTYKKIESGLKEVSRSLSRKIKGSQNWKDTKFQLAKKWEKVVNQFKHETHQIANDLVKKYDGIAIEKLQIKSMIKNRNLAKSIQQARWGILFQIIADKVEETGRQLVRVNPHNTTQKCSSCGELSKEKVKLAQRIFKCWHCDNELDRDVNSARNVLDRAIAENRFDQNLPPQSGK